jgi:hypothetical protein
MSKQNKNLVGCCGIYCGLCTKYQSKAPSRCIGCRCERYIRFRKWGGELYGSKAAEENLEKIKELGLEKWLEQECRLS